MILGIYGAGGLGRELLELSKQIDVWNKVVFIDDSVKDNENKFIEGIEVYNFNYIKKTYNVDEIKFVIAVGEPNTRELLFNRVKGNGYSCETLIHPNVYISDTLEIEEGVIIQVNAVLMCNTRIGKNTLVQCTASIGHDVNIGQHSVISTNCVVAGNCNLGEKVYIGLGVPVKENISIGSNSIIGMGSVVLKDLPENIIAMGNPARPMKSNIESKVFK